MQLNDSYQTPGKWHDIVLNPIGTKNGASKHIMSYMIKDLEPDSIFEAVVQARNRYGWNEISDLHQFFTRGSEPELSDMELVSRTSSNSNGGVLNQSKILLTHLGLCLLMIIFTR